MDMEFHKGISSSGKLYGFLPEFATVDEDCATFADEDNAIADEDSATFTMAESLTVSDEELLTAGVICNSLDEDCIKHIETSEELDSGIYRSIWYSCAKIECVAMQTSAIEIPRRIKRYSALGAAFFTKRRGLNSRGGNSNLSFPLTRVK